MAQSKVRGTDRRTATWIILLCFFASGMSGLIYQVVWVRELVLVFGATTLAVSTVLTAFMGGLALGSFICGRRSQLIARPLVLLGILDRRVGGRKRDPLEGLHEVLRQSLAVVKENAEVVLRLGVSLLGGCVVPESGLREILRPAFPVVVEVADEALRLDFAFLRGDVVIDTGAGNDEIISFETDISGSLRVDADAGDDTVQIDSSTVGAEVVLALGGGRDRVDLIESELDDRLTVAVGSGNDEVSIGLTRVQGAAGFFGGPGRDEFTASTTRRALGSMRSVSRRGQTPRTTRQTSNSRKGTFRHAPSGSLAPGQPSPGGPCQINRMPRSM